MPGSNYDRDLSVKEGFVLSKFLVKWEMILVYILILLNLVLLIFEPQLFFQAGTIQTIINSGFDSSPLVLGMVFILLLGDIDVSVAAQIVLGGMVTGLMMDAGIPSIVWCTGRYPYLCTVWCFQRLLCCVLQDAGRYHYDFHFHAVSWYR